MKTIAIDAVVIRYFRPKCAERCRRLGLVRSSGLPQAIFRIAGFHAKIAQILHQWALSVDQNIYHTDVR